MELLEHIYSDVLKSLHFSVTGHPRFEDELYAFYDSLAESALFRQNHNIRFLIGSICELKDHTTWEVEPYKQIYFKSFFAVDKISLLSFYFYAIKRLSHTLAGGSHINASKTIAESFNSQTNVRVTLSDYPKPFCKFDDRISLFEVRLPYIIFTEDIRKEIPELRDKLHDAISKVDPSKKAKSQEGKRRYYSLDAVEEDDVYREFFDLLFDMNEVRRVYQELDMILETRFARIIKNSSGVKSKELATACIGIGFICLYFNASLEYFTGIAKVQQIGLKRFEYRNLGGIAVGYQKRQPLSRAERAIFGLVADKLTSVIAGQIVVNELDEQQLQHRGFDTLNKFWDDYLNDLTHPDTSVIILASKIDKAIGSFLSVGLKKVLTDKTFQGISAYLEELKAATDKRKFIEDRAENVKGTFRFIPSRWAKGISDEFEIELGDGISSCHDYLICDMEYLNSIINSSITNSKQYNLGKDDLRITVDLSMQKKDGSPTIDLSEAAVIEISVCDNGGGCDLGEIPFNSTTFGKFKEWRHVVNAFGEVELRSGEKIMRFSPERQQNDHIPGRSGFETIVTIHKPSHE